MLTDPRPPNAGSAAHLELRFADETGLDQGPLWAPSCSHAISTDPTIPEKGTTFEVGMTGLFGNDKGKVQLNGSDLPIAYWMGNLIIANLSQGSSGILKVISATGIEGDPMQLLHYSGDVTYDRNDGGAPDIRVLLKPSFHLLPFWDYRGGVDELLIPGQLTGGMNWLEGSSVCAWAVVGQESDNEGGTYKYSGSGSKTYAQSTESVGFSKASGNYNDIEIDDSGNVLLQMTVQFPYHVVYDNPSKGIHDEWDTSGSAIVDIETTLDFDYSIPAGQTSNPSQKEAVSWKKFPPNPNPNEELPR